MKVLVLPQFVFDRNMKSLGLNDDNIEDKSNVILISIIGSDETEQHYFKSNHKNVLNLVFDDLSAEEKEKIEAEKDRMFVPKIELFNEEHAKQIVDFVERNKEVKSCIVHCAAGISRSGAVGLFINDFFGEQNYLDFMRDNNIKPNSFVSQTLNSYFRKEA